MTIKVISWNLNGLNARTERLLALLARHRPDIVCLQELKCVADRVPTDALHRAGYYVAVAGQKAYNGVALLARQPIEDVQVGLGDGVDDAQARFISGQVAGIMVASVYVPNGQSLNSNKCTYKLQWLARLGDVMARQLDGATPAMFCGDFNIAPRPEDVADVARWADTVLFAPPMRAALQRLFDLGFIDVFATHHRGGGVYSWWDYRANRFAADDGARIDLILATQGLACRSVDARIDRDERRGERPADHAPVIVRFDWPQ